MNKVKCPECDGSGKIMYMACYGKMPVEEYEYCDLCQGDGEFNEDEYLLLILSGKI